MPKLRKHNRWISGVAIIGSLSFFISSCSTKNSDSTTNNSDASNETTISSTSVDPVTTTTTKPTNGGVIEGMAPRLDPNNVYSETSVGKFSPNTANARSLVYVPSPIAGGKGTVDVIDQASMEVINTFTTGAISQHIVPSWDLKTLYVNASAANALIPIDPTTGKPGKPIPIRRPYNLYFTPDGSKAVVQDENGNSLDYYNPVTWKKLKVVATKCRGNNHADWSADGSFFVVSCEFSGELLKVDTGSGEILDRLKLPSINGSAMPQDVRLTPDGKKFYVADMQADRVWIIDADTFKNVGDIRTGTGAHGIYPSRDAKTMYVSNRGRHMNDEGRTSRNGEGSVSVIDPVVDKVIATWTIPGGGSPDMGDVSADGTKLWLSGRYDNEVYVFDTATGTLIKQIKVHPGPHGLCVWPQPGRYSLGHTGNLR